MRIAICDDNFKDCDILNNILQSHPIIENCSIDTFNDGVTLISNIQKDNNYDITFLDIDMPGINGIELGKRIKTLNPKTCIVFVTSYPEYAIDAYDCEAFNYLLKPINAEKANRILNKLLIRYIENNKFHIIKVKTEKIRIPIQDIYFIECCQKHIIYHMKNGYYDTVGNLSDTYQSLKEYGFYQIHQGYIVNLAKISRFNKYTAILIDGRTVAISVRKRTEVLTAYAKYIEVHV